MNEVIRQLNERKSVRVFTEQEIDEETVQVILKAAVMAPSTGNQQLYTIIRVSDQQLKERLAESCDHQSFIAQAKLVLVFCADCLKWYEAYRYAGCEARKPGEGDLLLAVDDAVTFIFSGIQFLSTLYSIQYVFDRSITDGVNSDLHVSLLCHFYQGI